MTNSYIDMDGVENASVGLVIQAKKDFIKGAKILYGLFKNIPTQEELKHSSGFRMITDPDIRWMYDAWNFVRDDPYNLFESGEDTVIDHWKWESIVKYYQDFYIKGAAILYYKKAVKTKPVYEITNSTLNKYIKDKYTREKFIESKNYILALPEGKDLIDSWLDMIYSKARSYDKYIKEGRMDEKTFTLFNKRIETLKSGHKEAIQKAKELFDSGLSIASIATELDVARGTALRYIREASVSS